MEGERNCIKRTIPLRTCRIITLYIAKLEKIVRTIQVISIQCHVLKYTFKCILLFDLTHLHHQNYFLKKIYTKKT